MGFKPLSPDGFYGWINVMTASIFMFALTIVMQSFSFFLPEWVNDFGWTNKDVSFALTINMVVMAFMSPLAGIFIGKYGIRLATIIGGAITIVGIYTLANIQSLWHLYLGNGVIVAIGITLGGMLGITTLMSNWFFKKRSLSISIPNVAMGVTGIIIAPTIPWLIIHYGWRSTYMMIIPIYFVFALLVPGIFFRNTPQELGQVPDGPAASEPPGNSPNMEVPEISKSLITPVDFTPLEAFKTKTMWLLLFFNALNMFAMGAIMAHGYAFLNDIGIPPVKAGFFMGITSSSMVAGQLLAGFLGLKIDIRRLIMLGCTAMIIHFILMVFASYSISIVYVYVIFGGIGVGINFVAIMNLLPNYFGVTHFPKIMGFALFFAPLIGSLGAPVCGYIKDVTGNYFLFWKIAAVLMTIGLIFLFFAKAPKHPSLQDT
ncbi:MFS transporter [Thermodesulfobacteriota bacterium]